MFDRIVTTIDKWTSKSQTLTYQNNKPKKKIKNIYIYIERERERERERENSIANNVRPNARDCFQRQLSYILSLKIVFFVEEAK